MSSGKLSLANIYCCNPLSRPGHTHRTSCLRVVPAWIKRKFSGLAANAKICNSCRVMVSRRLKEEEIVPSPQRPPVQVCNL
ncbi:unnamed protein product [Enterobius vermicularis]|uniref:Uncharacterized protein n=1 Tax=Enterobius vermicularis TaxID=51028 RepID=A0A0N4VRP7_ENTVE|nr:unnamed protein product [Enterobius vermicularis]